MEKAHLAVYGAVKMLRVYCSKCKGMTLVVDGIKQCCDKPAREEKINKIKRMVLGAERKKPTVSVQREILKLQGNKCLYCGKEFGSLYFRDGKVLPLKLHFDHLIPYVYSMENKYNFVAACNICNLIKSSKVFDTVEEVYHYVRYNREKKGIEYL